MSNKYKTVSPIFASDYIPLVFIVDEFFLKYASVTIASIIEHASTKYNYDIIIFIRKLSSSSKSRLKQMERNNVSIRFFDYSFAIKKYAALKNKDNLPELFARFLIPEVLRDYKHAIYIDSDMIVCDDLVALDGLLRSSNTVLSAVKDIGGFWNYYVPQSEYKNHLLNDLKLKQPENYFNAGLLAINLERFRERYPSEDLWSILASKKWKYKDQDAFNFLCNESLNVIGYEWNCIYSCVEEIEKYVNPVETAKWKKSLEKPKIIHYASDKKPWIYPNCKYGELFWKYALQSTFRDEVLVCSPSEICEANVMQNKKCIKLIRNLLIMRRK